MPEALRKVAAFPLRAAAFALFWLGDVLFVAGYAVNWIRMRWFAYDARPDDLFLVTYPRSGTTWLQMILYQLTSDGSMDFAHLSEKVPWYERAASMGTSIEAMKSPRMFKSHLAWSKIPKGGARYIYCCRDPRDVVVSNYHFYLSHHQRFKADFEHFFERFVRGKIHYGRWADHVGGWWEHRDDQNVLFIWYEDALADLEGTVRMIADFCGIAVDQARVPSILERCGFAYMKAHEGKFDHAHEVLLEKGLSAGGNFLRTGRTGQGREWLSSDQQQALDTALRKQTGHDVAELMAGSGIRNPEEG